MLVVHLSVGLEVLARIDDLNGLEARLAQAAFVVGDEDGPRDAADVRLHAIAQVGGQRLFMAMSLTATRPPGFRTRSISRKTAACRAPG